MRRGLCFSKSEKEVKVLDGVDGTGESAYTDEAWAPAELLYEPPLLEVTQSKGAFCTIHTRFAVALLPEDAFNLLADPNNRRVFKGIKEIVYRKILEDDGNRQYIEVEQVGRWKFLFLSGVLATRLFVEQKRLEKTATFVLAKQGGMVRKFTGSWKVEPMKASEAETMGALHTNSGVVKSSQTGNGGGDGAATTNDPIVGSWVTFEQVTEPTIKPPWPLSNYIRGIAEKVVRDMVADFQLECQRLSELPKTTSSSTSELVAATPQMDLTSKLDSDGHDLKGPATV